MLAITALIAVKRKLEVGGDIRTGGGGVNGWDNGECCFLLCVYDEVISIQSTFLFLILHLRIGEACRRWSFLTKNSGLLFLLSCSSFASSLFSRSIMFS